MKTLTSAFDAARVLTGLTVVTLVKIELPAKGGNPALTLRLSDRGSSGGGTYTTPGNTWYALISNIQRQPALVDANSGVVPSDGYMSLQIINLPTDLFSPSARFSSLDRNYKLGQASVTVYNWIEGESLAESDMAVEFVGTISEPVEYDQKNFSCDILSLSASLGRRKLGRLITQDDYPDAPEEVLGTFNNIVIGNCPKAPCRRTNAIGITAVRSVWIPGDTTLNVFGPTDLFPGDGRVEINGDVLNYTGKTDDTLTGITGGLVEHYKGEQVVERQEVHEFLVSDPAYAIKSIDAVYVKPALDGDYQKVPTSQYALDMANNLIRFNELPTALVSTDSRFLKAHFDEVHPSNTALEPDNARDPDLLTSLATINQSNPALVLKQTDEMAAAGEMGRVFVSVTYFQEAPTPNDSAVVSIDGIGNVGTLDKQADEDEVNVAGSTDISHSTLDTFSFPINVPVPSHSSSSTAHKTLTQGASSGPGQNINLISNAGPGGARTFNFPAIPGSAIQADYAIGLVVHSGTFGPGPVPQFLFGSRVVATYNPSKQAFDMTPNFSISGGGGETFNLSVNHGFWTVSVSQAERLVTYTPSVSTTPQAQNTVKGGANLDTTGTKPLSGTSEKSSNVVTKNIEITEYVNGNWAWFTDKILRITYTGSSDARSYYIALARFNIEFAQLTRAQTDQIFADVQGVTDDADGTITGTPSALLERPDHVLQWSLDVGVGAQRDTALEFEGGGTFELEGGGALELEGTDASYINATSFAAAGALYANAVSGGYRVAGVIDQLLEVSAFWGTIGVNTRSVLFFKRGEAHLFFRPLNGGSDSTTTVRNLDEDEVETVGRDGQGAISVEKSPGDAIVNHIDLRYGWDWGAGRFRKNPVTVQDALSISRYTVQKNAESFQMHWIPASAEAMAQSVAEFYLAEFKEYFKVVTFNAPFTMMDLDPFDIVGFRHDLLGTGGGSFEPGLILSANRQMGVAAAGKMNRMQFVIRMVNTGALSTSGLGVQALGTTGLGGQETLD